MTLESLSGRVDSLEANFTNVQQDLLQKIDITTQSAFSRVINQQLDQFSALLDRLDTQYRALQGLYQNLVSQENARWSYFTGFSGTLYTSFTDHTGTLTGEGVHGHT